MILKKQAHPSESPTRAPTHVSPGEAESYVHKSRMGRWEGAWKRRGEGPPEKPNFMCMRAGLDGKESVREREGRGKEKLAWWMDGFMQSANSGESVTPHPSETTYLGTRDDCRQHTQRFIIVSLCRLFGGDKNHLVM